MKINIPAIIATFLLATFNFQFSTSFAQGGLTPPGPPGATMLTLSQVEPRTPVDATHTPGNSTTEFLIASSGSYYLTTNIIGVAGEQGIEISANNVSLDLNGFSVTGASTSYSGISILAGVSNSVVRNGIISGWGNLYTDLFSSGYNVAFEDLIISGAHVGIQCFGNGGIIRNCTVSACNQYGIYLAGSNYLVACNCLFENNTGNNGNGAAMNIISANNRIDDNYIVGSSPSGYGILVNSSGANTNNIVIRNSVAGGGGNNYSINLSVNDVGPIGNASTNTSPWGNLSR